LKNDVNVSSKSNMQKNFLKNISFLLASSRSMMKRAGSGSGSTPKCHGSATLLDTQRQGKERKKDKGGQNIVHICRRKRPESKVAKKKLNGQ
jgi:hypothetical protein